MSPLLLALVVVAGATIAFQSPINASLARSVGVVNATLVSFAIGTVLVACAAVINGQLGQLRELPNVAWWQLIGGALGAAFVVVLIIAVPRVGVGTVMLAVLAGQLVTAMVIDHFGWFGVAQRGLNAGRLAAIPLVVLAAWLAKR